MVEPVRFFAADHPHQYRNLRKHLQNEYQKHLNDIVHVEEKDFRFHVGILRGLGLSILLCDELEKKEQK